VAKTLAIVNQKGGVGKTTTAVNLAAGLALAERPTLLVDLDPQGNATTGLGVQKSGLHPTIYHVLLGGEATEKAIKVTAVPGLRVLPADIDLVGAEIELVGVERREHRLRDVLEAVSASYDYIVIDCPPSLGLLTINALVASNGVIVPVQCEYLSLRGLVQLENTLSMIRENLNPDVAIQGILPTMFDKRLLHSREAVEILTENFGDLVLETKIRKTVRYAEAPVKGQSILKYDPSGDAAFMYRQLAKEVLDGTSARQHA
jgi:chromosome partitioning protein